MGKIPERLVSEAVEFAAFRVLLKLTIPRLRVELRKPSTESAQIGVRQMGHSIFDFLHRRHVGNLPRYGRCGNCQILFPLCERLG